VAECRRFTKHEAIRRQMQYIGRIMRDIDAAPIAQQLAEIEAPSKRQTALFHVAEKWRDEFVQSPEAIARFVKDFPEADPQRLRELAEQARDEKRTSKPPKRFRELFHVLNGLLQDHARRNP
jgi:ribosome-associated protein